jgi:thioredoxin reductase (NADPH)
MSITENPSEYFDVAIIGAGAAGLTAAIYTSRRALKTLIISKDVGGQAALTTEIENYPGVGLVDGFDLMNRFLGDAKKFGAILKSEEAKKIEHIDDDFLVTTNSNTYRAAAIILAFGLTPRDLGVPGEEDFKGKGVSYCATCDGPLFKGKTVAVVGGGNSALDAAEYISRLASKVYLLHRRDQFRGDEILVERVKNIPNIEIFFNTGVGTIKGSTHVETIDLVNATNETPIKPLAVDGVFVEIGHVAKTEWVGGLVEYDDHKQIKVNRSCETKTPGLFAAGDVTDIAYKQIIISGGEGSKAALQAYKYLQATKGIKGVNIDWGVSKK